MENVQKIFITNEQFQKLFRREPRPDVQVSLTKDGLDLVSNDGEVIEFVTRSSRDESIDAVYTKFAAAGK